MDAEKLSKRDTLKRKERERERKIYTHALTHEGEEKEEIKGEDCMYEAGDREKEEKME